MQKSLFITGLLGFYCFGAHAADLSVQTCEQIREQIKAQTVVLPKTNVELLQKISIRQECQFSAPEVYRAAFGNKPFPKQDARRHRSSHDDD
jgi:hypothetical protein